ncbi:D-glycero-beta-D-manno-heptose 1-phosphate adenylyltransferase [Actinacidiphila paucisporea]|uniref:D-glycero-beta-D-manno-heptose 1-phosphate adenylyltransferase n=1 Tax=Actinacidiphila paucisporea TaxID=310782 RepID=A0A1M7LND9_9ACTN|nr:D-glycero-beta-D-manno-heptose 1-phosphate adenylyltransferase [Actinacidiphila paucisporea]SHM79591.1 rfaE bifunctional protein, domain II [Actinacidiphila paucisporea]
MSTPVVVVGDALLDHDLTGRAERLAPDAPVPVVSGLHRGTRPGGAALAAWFAAADGREVTLVTALGDDPASRSLRDLLAPRMRLIELPLDGWLSRKTRVLAGGHPLLRLDEGDGRAAGSTPEALRAVAAAPALLVSDYGRGTPDTLREALAEAALARPMVWDPHPRGGAPVPSVRLVTPSASEARALAPAPPPRQGDHHTLRTAARDARALVRHWDARSVAVTLGERGALLSHGAEAMLVPAPTRAAGDPCGAGDRFAAAAAGLLADGELAESAVQGAVRAATEYVAAGGAGALTFAGTAEGGRETAGRDGGSAPQAAAALAADVRAAGGTVVAAGGCFDLLHAGHVALLQAARSAGDCLIVCVNSDASVRRRKGDTRPLVPAADRVRVLQALECVDAVAVFEEDTPERLLAALRPHIWAKGADYARSDLPESALLETWGGQVLLLPYLDGRSTTALAARASGAERPPARTEPAR